MSVYKFTVPDHESIVIYKTKIGDFIINVKADKTATLQIKPDPIKFNGEFGASSSIWKKTVKVKPEAHYLMNDKVTKKALPQKDRVSIHSISHKVTKERK